MTELAPYPEYKDSGVGWLGDVPAAWSVLPLMSCVRESRLRNSQQAESNLLSLSYGRIVRKDISANDGLLPESFSTYQIVQPDDVVFRFTDLQNDKRSLRSALVRERGIITSAYLAVTPRTIEPRYFAYCMRDVDLRKVFYAMGGGLRQSMNFADIRRLPVLVPTTSEQHRIADFLDRETAEIDAFIADQEELIGLLTERRAATITHAVTKGLNRSAPMKDSGVEWLGEVPASWAVGPMSRWCTVTLGKMLDAGKPAPEGSEPRPYLRAANIRPGWISLDSVYEMPMRPAEVSNLNLLAGDLLVVEGGATVGMNAIVLDDMPGWTYQKTVNRVRSARGPSTRFIGYYLDVLRLRGVIEMISAASTFQHLTAEKLGALTLAAPCTTESVAIADYLDYETAELDATIADAREAITLSNERRAALISAAVTGKIDVRRLA